MAIGDASRQMLSQMSWLRLSLTWPGLTTQAPITLTSPNSCGNGRASTSVGRR